MEISKQKQKKEKLLMKWKWKSKFCFFLIFILLIIPAYICTYGRITTTYKYNMFWCRLSSLCCPFISSYILSCAIQRRPSSITDWGTECGGLYPSSNYGQTRIRLNKKCKINKFPGRRSIIRRGRIIKIRFRENQIITNHVWH